MDTSIPSLAEQQEKCGTLLGNFINIYVAPDRRQDALNAMPDVLRAFQVSETLGLIEALKATLGQQSH